MNDCSPTKAMRLAWVTPVCPPTPSGQSRVLGALLDCEELHDSIIFTTDAAALEGPDHACTYAALPVPTTSRATGLPRIGPMLQLLVDRALVRACARTIEKTLKRRPVDAIVGCTANRALLPAAWLAAKRLGVPFVAYLFDDPVYQWPNSGHRRVARSWERQWSAGAAAVIAPNEVLAADVETRCDIACEVLRNCISLDAFAGETGTWPTKSGELSIVYTGAVYHAHTDAFVNLVRALPKLPVKTTLHIYTDQDETDLRRQGIDGPVMFHGHRSAREIHAIQRQADILFLPLAFNSPIPEVIRSSAPGKMGEYLASGRPVLVHAPADSFVASFHATRACGFVADVLAPDATARVITELIENTSLRDKTIERARAAAQEFSPETVRRGFIRIMTNALAGAPGVRQ